MAFTPRSFQEILTDMIAYVQAHTTITDFNPGSVIRTMLEASALEDDEQYFQMIQLLDAFSITTASGEALDRRLADFNLVRSSAKPSFGSVRFFSSNLVSDQVAADASVGATSLKIFDSTDFPSTGFPYTIRVGEGTVRAQDLTVTALNTATHTFTVPLGSLTSAAEVGDRVSLVTGATSHTITAGTTIQAPATSVERAKIYTTQEPAFIAAGNYYSNEVVAKSSDPGANNNTSTNRITQFVGSPPFSGAGVRNTTAMEGGRNREKDSDFRERALNLLQSLSRGTPLALRSYAIGVEDRATSQRIISASIVEAYDDDEVILYVDDGTGLDPDIVSLPSNSLASSVSAGALSVTLNDASDFPSSGHILIEESELKEYIKTSANVLSFDSGLSNAHSSGDIVRQVDIVSDGTESGERRFELTNFPVVRSSERIYTKASGAGSWTLQSVDDYYLNKGTGEFLILDESGLTAGTQVVSNYSYYTNIVAEVQKVLEGSPEEAVSYPGVKAAGIFLAVEAPTIRRITVRATITAEPTYSEENLVPLVRQSIENYINSLTIGKDVIRTRIIDAAHDVEGLRDITVTVPSTNITVLEDELPVPYDSSGNSLVTVL